MIAMTTTSLRRFAAALTTAAAALLATALLAAPAGATTFCVPGFDPGRCPDNGQNVAQADLETAMQSDATDGIPDTVVVGPGTYVDADSLSPSGTDPLTVEGAGAGGGADPEATRLTTASSGNIYVVNLAAAMSRPIAMRDLTVVVPESLPDNQGAAMQLSGDTLERVDVEIANPGSNALPSWPGGGTYREGEIYAAGSGVLGHAIRSGNSGFAGQITIEDATIVEPTIGIWGQDESVPISVVRTTIERPSQLGVFATESGQVSIANSVVVVDGTASALAVNATGTGDASMSADHVTAVQEEPGAGQGVTSRSQSSGEANFTVENSIVRGFASNYFRHSTGGDADLTIHHSNFEPVGVDSGPGTLDTGAGNIDADPMFASAPPYGSPADLALSPGSPSIDTGDPGPGGLPEDFLGAPRPLDGDEDGAAVRDQGAFEAAAPSTESPSSDPEPGPGPGDDGHSAAAIAASPADAAVALRVLGRRARINRRGIAWLRLHCPASEASPPCRGRLVLRSRAKLRLGGGKRRRVVLARAGFLIAAGATKAVRLRLGARKQRLLKRNRRARRLLAVARVVDGAGNRGAVRKRLHAQAR